MTRKCDIMTGDKASWRDVFCANKIVKRIHAGEQRPRSHCWDRNVPLLALSAVACDRGFWRL